jgi:hypothetical protein
MVDFCEQGDGHSGSIKAGDVFTKQINIKRIKKTALQGFAHMRKA